METTLSDVRVMLQKKEASLVDELDRVRQMLALCQKSGQGNAPQRVPSVDVPAQQGVASFIHAALDTFPTRQAFDCKGVFEAMGRSDIEYLKVRVNISAIIMRLVRQGRLEQISRGKFCKPGTSNSEVTP